MLFYSFFTAKDNWIKIIVLFSFDIIIHFPVIYVTSLIDQVLYWTPTKTVTIGELDSQQDIVRLINAY